MPNRFARAPGSARSPGGSTASRLPARSELRSAPAKVGSAAIFAAWSGQPRNRVARSRSRKRMVVAGVGSVSVSRVAPAIMTESRPAPNPPIQKNGMGM